MRNQRRKANSSPPFTMHCALEDIKTNDYRPMYSSTLYMYIIIVIGLHVLQFAICMPEYAQNYCLVFFALHVYACMHVCKYTLACMHLSIYVCFVCMDLYLCVWIYTCLVCTLCEHMFVSMASSI